MRIALWLCPALLWAGHNALVPQPQKIRYGQASLALDGLSVCLSSPAAAEDRFAAQTLAQALGGLPVLEKSSARCITLARTGPPAPLPEADERPGPDSRESYRLSVTGSGAEIRARSSAGLYYGAQTLAQLVEGKALPEVEIEDWPSSPYRGVMIDVSHGALPTPAEIQPPDRLPGALEGQSVLLLLGALDRAERLFHLINPGARYTPGPDARHHPIRPRAARGRGAVPGVLRPPARSVPHRAICRSRRPAARRRPQSAQSPMQPCSRIGWGRWRRCFPSPWFHIGLDEPWELERAGSAAAGGVEPGKLYLDHLNRMADLVRGHGKRVLFWADVTAGAALFEKLPGARHQSPGGNHRRPLALPRGEGLHPHARAVQQGASAAGDRHRHLGLGHHHAQLHPHLREHRWLPGRRHESHGTIGIINTNWADDAQIALPHTLPGIAYGAAAAWQPGAHGPRALLRELLRRASTAPDAAAEMAAGAGRPRPRPAGHLRALGSEDMFRLWDDLFAPDRLARAQATWKTCARRASWPRKRRSASTACGIPIACRVCC